LVDQKHWLLGNRNGAFSIGTSSDNFTASSSMFAIATSGMMVVGRNAAGTRPAADLFVVGSFANQTDHYSTNGYGAAFSDQPLPGKASALAPAGGSAGGGGGGGFLGLPGAIGDLGSTFKTAAIVAPIVLVGGALVVVGAAKATGMDKRAKGAADQVKDTAGKAATVAAVA